MCGWSKYHPLTVKVMLLELIKCHLNEDCGDSSTNWKDYHYYPLNSEMSYTSSCSDFCSGVSWSICIEEE